MRVVSRDVEDRSTVVGPELRLGGGERDPVLAVAFGIVTILSVQGFGFLLPGEIRMYREVRSASPDPSVIAVVGKQNAMLGGVKGSFQLRLVLDVVYLRYGGFPV